MITRYGLTRGIPAPLSNLSGWLYTYTRPKTTTCLPISPATAAHTQNTNGFHCWAEQPAWGRQLNEQSNAPAGGNKHRCIPPSPSPPRYRTRARDVIRARYSSRATVIMTCTVPPRWLSDLYIQNTGIQRWAMINDHVPRWVTRPCMIIKRCSFMPPVYTATVKDGHSVEYIPPCATAKQSQQW